jgi:hypothetical protein
VYRKDTFGVHLGSVGVIRQKASKSEAIILANALIRSALPRGESFRPIEGTDDSDIIRNFGRQADSNVVLDARVFREEHMWLINVYWSRMVID